MSNLTSKAARNRIAILFFASSSFILFHYLTPATENKALLHDLYRRILYIPILLAAFWFGIRGGLICSLGISVAYFPHIYHHWGGKLLDANLNRTLEAMMYVIIGGITGYLIDTLRQEQNRLADALSDLKRRTRQVFETEEQLRRADKLAALGELTTGLAHEIRNPLASIQGAVEILEDPDTTDAQREEFRSVLFEETRHLDHVLRNFLEYAREKRSRNRTSSSVAEVLQRLQVLLNKKISANAMELRVDIPPDMPKLAIEENLLEQVLFNLIMNAIQAMTDGGTIAVAASRDVETNTATLSISDEGPGVPHEMQERVFDPFVTTKETGTGLGLSIVHRIVTSEGGSIAIDADYSAGARFVVRLPAADPSSV